jgi:hypothetical protein
MALKRQKDGKKKMFKVSSKEPNSHNIILKTGLKPAKKKKPNKKWLVKKRLTASS